MFAVRPLLGAAVLLGLAGTAVASPPELSRRTPTGWHGVEHECFVDLGTFLDCVTWRYRLQDGDTIGEVAQRELGSARRQRDILALNPGLRPDRVRAGRTIIMPPRSNGCERDSPRYVFFAWGPASGGWSTPRHLADGRVHRVSHGTRLFAVPVSRLPAVCKASGAQPLCAKALAEDPQVARSGTFQLLATVPDSDPTRRIVTHYKVVAIGDGAVRLRRTGHALYDGAGRRIEAPSDGSGGFTALQALTFLLMVAGIGWAVARAQHTRAAGRSAAAWED